MEKKEIDEKRVRYRPIQYNILLTVIITVNGKIKLFYNYVNINIVTYRLLCYVRKCVMPMQTSALHGKYV